jgi:hypothetical protein
MELKSRKGSKPKMKTRDEDQQIAHIQHEERAKLPSKRQPKIAKTLAQGEGVPTHTTGAIDEAMEALQETIAKKAKQDSTAEKKRRAKRQKQKSKQLHQQEKATVASHAAADLAAKPAANAAEANTKTIDTVVVAVATDPVAKAKTNDEAKSAQTEKACSAAEPSHSFPARTAVKVCICADDQPLHWEDFGQLEISEERGEEDDSTGSSLLDAADQVTTKPKDSFHYGHKIHNQNPALVGGAPCRRLSSPVMINSLDCNPNSYLASFVKLQLRGLCQVGVIQMV